MNGESAVKSISKRKGSHQFFENRDCEYYPCHDSGLQQINCLFCFCPMYYAICLGEPEYMIVGGSTIKDCSSCDYPHKPENYKMMLEYLTLVLKD
ncbi:MAG: metal-binding protein [Nitrospirota bacterium]|nr:MAG: metal-binding protein [Nitrospirota bacterium]